MHIFNLQFGCFFAVPANKTISKVHHVIKLNLSNQLPSQKQSTLTAVQCEYTDGFAVSTVFLEQ